MCFSRCRLTVTMLVILFAILFVILWNFSHTTRTRKTGIVRGALNGACTPGETDYPEFLYGVVFQYGKYEST